MIWPGSNLSKSAFTLGLVMHYYIAVIFSFHSVTRACGIIECNVLLKQTAALSLIYGVFYNGRKASILMSKPIPSHNHFHNSQVMSMSIMTASPFLNLCHIATRSRFQL